MWQNRSIAQLKNHLPFQIKISRDDDSRKPKAKHIRQMFETAVSLEREIFIVKQNSTWSDTLNTAGHARAKYYSAKA